MCVSPLLCLCGVGDGLGEVVAGLAEVGVLGVPLGRNSIYILGYPQNLTLIMFGVFRHVETFKKFSTKAAPKFVPKPFSKF